MAKEWTEEELKRQEEAHKRLQELLEEKRILEELERQQDNDR